MPVRDCMTGSPFCPGNMDSKFSIPGYEKPDCSKCVQEGIENNEIPKCFFCKLEEEGPMKAAEFTFEQFAKKVTDWMNKDK